VIEGVLERRVGQVVVGKAVLGVRQAVVLDLPVRPALALELLVEEVLMEVDLAVDPLAGERLLRVRDLGQVGVVV